jgi:serine/threonine protein kinase/tetratricopeptide (TPR) repeat protein
MKPERWQKVDELLSAALEREAGQRVSFLAQACEGDEELQKEVLELLSAHQAAANFLDEPPMSVGTALAAAPQALASTRSIPDHRRTEPAETIPSLVETPSSQTELGLGQRSVLGRYVFLNKLGSGGMGVVYRAKDLKLGREVAIKLLSSQLATNEMAKARFLREAQAASALDHPNIGAIFDIGEEDGELFIVMALYEGQTLSQRLENGALPLAEAIDILRQVAKGLERAHASGIIHRDIKPANVMLTSTGAVKILDFGLAKLVADSASQTVTQAGQAMGTLLYMSPEQLKGEAVDKRSDLWSLGVVGHEILAGACPFRAESNAATAMRILSEEPPSLSSVPGVQSWLAEVITQLLQKDPAKRPESAGEVISHLDQQLGYSAARHANDSAREGRWSYRAGNLVKRHRAAAAPLSAAVLVTVTLLGAMRLSHRGMLSRVFGKPELSSMFYSVNLKDENGQQIERKIPKPEFHKRIDIFDFDNESGNPSLDWLSQAIGGLLAIDLLQDPFIVSASLDRWLSPKRRAAWNPDKVMPLALKHELAQSAHMEYFVTGSFQKPRDGYEIRVDLYRTKQARIIKNYTFRGADLFQLVDEATLQLRRDLEIPSQHIESVTVLPVKEVSTSSLDALREFTLAAGAWFFSNNFQDAAKHYERATGADPSFAMAHLSLANTYYAMNQVAKAEASFAAARQNEYKLSEPMRLMARQGIYFLQKEPEKSLSVLNQWVTLYPDDVTAQELLADRFQSKGQLEKEAEVRHRILDIDHGNIDQLLKLGGVYGNLGDYEKELESYKQYVKQAPREPKGYVRLASLYERLARFEEAQSTYQQALFRDPDSVDALVGLGQLHMRVGDFTKALQTYEETLKRSQLPQDKVKAYQAEIGLFSYRAQWRRALDVLALELLETKKYAPPSWVLNAEINNIHIYVRAGQQEKAISLLNSLEQQLKESPPNATLSTLLQFGYVLLYTEQGNGEKVIPVIDSWNELQKQRGGVSRGLFLFQGKGYELTKDYDRAIQSYEQYVKMYPTNFDGAVRLGRCYRLNGDFDKAEANLLQALKFFPAHPRAHYELSVLHAQRGNLAKAREHLKKALDGWSEADPNDEVVKEARALASTLAQR